MAGPVLPDPRAREPGFALLLRPPPIGTCPDFQPSHLAGPEFRPSSTINWREFPSKQVHQREEARERREEEEDPVLLSLLLAPYQPHILLLGGWPPVTMESPPSPCRWRTSRTRPSILLDVSRTLLASSLFQLP